MDRASAGIRVAVVCTVLSVSWLAAGPAQADVGDLVDGVVGDGAGETVRDTANGTVDQLTGTTDTVVKDVVRHLPRPAEPAAPPPEGTAPAAPADATGQNGGAAPAPPPPAAAPSPAHPAAPVADASPAPSPHASSHASSQRQETHHARSTRKRTSVDRRLPHGSRNDGAVHRPTVAEREASQEVVMPSAEVAEPCTSGSLAVPDLRRCARATSSLPGLGGVPVVLLPSGLVMVGVGLVLVAWGRRRRTVGPVV